MKKLILTIIFVFIANLALADAIDNALNNAGFKEKEIPSRGRGSLREANYSNDEYYVQKIGQNISINLITKDNFPPRTNNFKTSKIEFRGTNMGEWGGELTAKKDDGSAEILIKDNVVSIIPANDVLYAFTGLAHLSMDRGAVYKITSIDSSPKVEKLTLLPQAPAAVLVDQREQRFTTFIIFTSGGVSTLSPKYSNLSVPATNLFWASLYPNSAVQENNRFLIGIRSGVAVVELNYNKLRSIRYFTK